MSLLKDAKSVATLRHSTPITAEEIELALAWARGEVTMTQAGVALAKARGLKKHSMGGYIIVARALKQYIQDKKI